jgi:hypothetical protein
LKERYKVKKPSSEANIHLFENEIVKFNFKIPSHHGRQMLFEKVQYILERNQKKEKDKNIVKDNIFK